MGTRNRPGQEKPSTGVLGPLSAVGADVDTALAALAAVGVGGGNGAAALPGVRAGLGATAPSPDGDAVEDDPRVVAISLALQDSAELWVQTVDGEVQLDTEVAAIIALATLGEGYCSERCHDEEYQAIVGYVRDFTPRSGTDCSCRDEILAGIEAASGVKDDPER